MSADAGEINAKNRVRWGNEFGGNINGPILTEGAELPYVRTDMGQRKSGRLVEEEPCIYRALLERSPAFTSPPCASHPNGRKGGYQADKLRRG